MAGAERPQPRPEPRSQPRWTAGRIAMIVVGTIVALVGMAVIAAGAFGLWLQTTQRDDGYVMTSDERLGTGGFALATRTLHVSSDVPGFLYGRDWLGKVRIRGESANPARGIFIGIARKDDVDRYLARVGHSEVVDVDGNPFSGSYDASYRTQRGGAPRIAPLGARFWVARAAGRGSQALTWTVKPGSWAVVAMRPDGSRGVVADMAAGAKLPALLWGSIVAIVIGLIVLGGGAALIYFGGREPSAPATSAPPPPPPAT